MKTKGETTFLAPHFFNYAALPEHLRTPNKMDNNIVNFVSFIQLIVSSGIWFVLLFTANLTQSHANSH